MPTSFSAARIAASLSLLALGATPLFAPAPAGAAAKPDLRVTSVRTLPSAAAGAALPVRVALSTSGRTRARPAVAVYLSRDRRRSKDDVRLTAKARASRGRRATLAFQVAIPGAQSTGPRRVIACVDDPGKIRERSERNNCRVAPGRLIVQAAGVEAKSARDLIAADLAAGRLKPDTALAYRVFAEFGDAHLPSRYAGAATGQDDDTVMREAASRWKTLSPSVRRQIGQYFLPPPARDALAARKTKAKAKAADAGDPVECMSDQFKPKAWTSIPAAGGKIRLSWLKERPEDGAQAKAMAADLTTAYARFKQILGREPLSDAKVKCYHGPDGALDVYIHPISWKAAVTIPASLSTDTKADCEGYPGFIVANAHNATFSTRFTLAHELFHAFQMSYHYAAGCEDSTWLDEGSANWAAHSAFPLDDSEHFFTLRLEFPNGDITLGDYESWPLFLWMEKTLGDGSIRKTYEALPKQDALHAADTGMGTWRQKFLDFAKHAWNRAPYTSFADWDRLTYDLRPHYQPVVPVHLFLAGQEKRTAYAEFNLSPRGRDYKQYQVTDDQLREITFKNPLAGQPDARIGAILTLADGSTRWEDWSGKERVRMCRDTPQQNVTQIVLVYANSQLDKMFSKGAGINGTPEMQLRNTCDDLPWHFEVLWGQLTYDVDGWRPGNSPDGLCGLDGFETRDQLHFAAAADGQGYTPDQNIVARQKVGSGLEGTFKIHAPVASFDHILKGCKGWDDGGPKTSCTATRHDPKYGGFDVGFTLSAESRDAQEATLRWWVPPAIAGYFDADDSVCNVGTLDNSVPVGELTESGVLMSDLESGKPITLTQTGSKTWNADNHGHPVVLGYTWEFKMRIQRVNADGSPL